MTLTISCKDLGSPCTEDVVSGETVDALIKAMCAHAVAKHGRTMEELQQPEMQQAMRSAIKQSARPQSARTSKLEL